VKPQETIVQVLGTCTKFWLLQQETSSCVGHTTLKSTADSTKVLSWLGTVPSEATGDYSTSSGNLHIVVTAAENIILCGSHHTESSCVCGFIIEN